VISRGGRPSPVRAAGGQTRSSTALSASPTTLPSLLAFARPGHVLFGSDTPFAPYGIVSYFTQRLDASDLLDDRQRQQINRGSAELLLSHNRSASNAAARSAPSGVTGR
jgi:hypothetical protein